MLLNAVKYLEPPPRLRSAAWLEAHVTMPKGTETAGLPFSLSAFPHVESVCDAFDDPLVRFIILNWGTRLGKTTVSLSLMAKTAGQNPRNMMFSSSTKEAAGRVVQTRLYPLLENTAAVRDQLLPEMRRNRFLVELEACNIFVGWSGSKTSLADVGAWFGVGNEIDKWDSDSSEEADPLSLFLNRFKGFPGHKIILESTPTIRGRSRIEYWLNRSNQHRRWVPCPHCGEFQILVKGAADTPYGIKWDAGDDGRQDPERAAATAHYVCRHCQGRVDDHHRLPMLRGGVWCPEGCTVDREGRAIGEPRKASREIMGFGPLPSWYALTERWGSFAARWVAAQRRPRDLQDVVNSYMAETWHAKREPQTWETVAQRLSAPYSRGKVPDECGVLTIGIDVQDAYFVWVLVGWAPEDRAFLIDYGEVLTWGELRNEILARRWPGMELAELPIAMGGMDSGARTNEVYSFCQQLGDALRPTKGFDGLDKPIVASSLEDSRRNPSRAAQAKAKKMYLWKFSKAIWQEELQRRLDLLKAGDAGSLSIPAECAKDQDFLEQLLNNSPVEQESGKTIWEKLHASDPDDYRDALVIARVVKEMWTRGNESRVAIAAAARRRAPTPNGKSAAAETPEKKANRFLKRPGGWIEGMR